MGSLLLLALVGFVIGVAAADDTVNLPSPQSDSNCIEFYNVTTNTSILVPYQVNSTCYDRTPYYPCIRTRFRTGFNVTKVEKGRCTPDCPGTYPDCKRKLNTCYSKTEDNKDVCSSHGDCIGLNKCKCKPGYSGGRCNMAYCFGKLGNVGCGNRGFCRSTDVCDCYEGYYPPKCQACPVPEHCSRSVCTNKSISYCNKCYKQGDTWDTSDYWPSNTNTSCTATCAAMDNWCWPGGCKDGLVTSCKCRHGFTKIASTNKCQLSAEPSLTEELEIQDINNNIYTFNSTTETLYINKSPQILNVRLYSGINVPIDVTKSPRYIKENSTVVGIVAKSVSVVKISPDGREIKIIENGAGFLIRSNCTDNNVANMADDQRPCEYVVNITNIQFTDGERLCAKMSAISGGEYKYQYYTGRHNGTETFHGVAAMKEVCAQFDLKAPIHCSETNPPSCSANDTNTPLTLVKTSNTTVRLDSVGWLDQNPTNLSSSGLSHVTINVFSVKFSDKSAVKFESVYNGSFNEVFVNNLSITVPETSTILLVQLTVVDKVGNAITAARTIMTQNSSKIEKSKNSSLTLISDGLKVNGHIWATSKDQFCFDWSGLFFNDFYRHFAVLSSQNQTSMGLDMFVTDRTINTRGVIGYYFSISVNKDDPAPWLKLSNSSQENICINATTNDGDRLNFTIRAEDLSGNTRDEAITIIVASSSPNVRDLSVYRETIATSFISSYSDLSDMMIEFTVIDNTSGVDKIDWSLTGNSTSDLILTGTEKPMHIIQGPKKPGCMNVTNCYCTVLEDCLNSSYSITFANSDLALNKTDPNGYTFRLNATNKIGLQTQIELLIQVDPSSPEPGFVTLGSGVPGFTSNSTVTVRWNGFRDNDSGISYYIVALDARCINQDKLRQRIRDQDRLTEMTKDTFAIFQLQDAHAYRASVIAYNKALKSSVVVCSDPVEFVLEPPNISNLVIEGAATRRRVICFNSSEWLLNSNLTYTKLVPENQCGGLETNNTENIEELIFPVTSNTLTLDDRGILGRSNNHDIFISSNHMKFSWAEIKSGSHSVFYKIGTRKSFQNSSEQTSVSFRYSVAENNEFHAIIDVEDVADPFYVLIQVSGQSGLHREIILGPLIIDTSAPKTGKIEILKLEGKLGNTTSADIITFSWKGFVDNDSDIKRYVVAVASSCLTVNELTSDHGDNQAFEIFETTNQSAALPIYRKGTYHISLLAFNLADIPSNVACSPAFEKLASTEKITTCDVDGCPIFFDCKKDGEGVRCEMNPYQIALVALGCVVAVILFYLGQQCYTKRSNNKSITGSVDDNQEAGGGIKLPYYEMATARYIPRPKIKHNIGPYRSSSDSDHLYDDSY